MNISIVRAISASPCPAQVFWFGLGPKGHSSVCDSGGQNSINHIWPAVQGGMTDQWPHRWHWPTPLLLHRFSFTCWVWSEFKRVELVQELLSQATTTFQSRPQSSQYYLYSFSQSILFQNLSRALLKLLY